jgi:hypothetical protein
LSVPARDGRVAGAVFLAALCFYLLTAGGHLYTADDWAKYKVTQSLVERGSVDVPREPHVYGIPGRDDTWVSIFPIGSSLAAIPLYVAGTLLEVSGDHAREIVLRGCVSTLNQFIVPALCALFFLLSRRLGAECRHALLVTMCFAVGTMVWPFSKHFWSEPGAALCLVGATLVVWAGAHMTVGRALAAGVLCGTAFLFKYEICLFFPAVLWWMLRRARSGNQRVALMCGWAAGAALMSLPTLWYNHARFGSPWRIGYGGGAGAEAASSGGPTISPLAVAARELYVMLVGPGRGFIWYNLPVVAAAVGWRRLVKSSGRRAVFLALAVVPLPLFLALTGRTATWAWGPRLLFPVVPFVLAPLALAGRRLLVIAAIAGFAVNIGAVAVNFHDAIEDLRDAGQFRGWEWTRAVDTQPRYSPIVWHLRLLGPYAKRTVHAIESRPSSTGGGGSLGGYDVDMRKDRFDVIWLVLLATGLPRVIILTPVVLLGAGAVAGWRLAVRWAGC